VTPELQDAARKLAALTPQERIALQAQVEQDMLTEAEAAKVHPLQDFVMPDNAWNAFCAHVMDGGGVNDCMELGRSILQRVYDRNQDATFWDDVVHFIKACLKGDGHVLPVPGSTAVVLRGIGPQSSTVQVDSAALQAEASATLATVQPGSVTIADIPL
jgi:hypothetical protein